MTLAVDNPIVNSPFEEPLQYWEYSEGQPLFRQGCGGVHFTLNHHGSGFTDTAPA